MSKIQSIQFVTKSMAIVLFNQETIDDVDLVWEGDPSDAIITNLDLRINNFAQPTASTGNWRQALLDGIDSLIINTTQGNVASHFNLAKASVSIKQEHTVFHVVIKSRKMSSPSTYERPYGESVEIVEEEEYDDGYGVGDLVEDIAVGMAVGELMEDAFEDDYEEDSYDDYDDCDDDW